MTGQRTLLNLRFYILNDRGQQCRRTGEGRKIAKESHSFCSRG
jgi:hypothetical protein